MTQPAPQSKRDSIRMRARFTELLEAHGPQAVAYARQMVGDSQAAEDLVQETFLALYKVAERYDMYERDPRPLIFKALTRRALNFRRDRAAKPARSVEDLSLGNAHESGANWNDRVGDHKAGTPLESLEANERTRILNEAMMALPEKQRQAMHLRINEELQYEQIAEIIGETPDNVGVLIFRARSGLKKALEAYLEG